MLALLRDYLLMRQEISNPSVSLSIIEGEKQMTRGSLHLIRGIDVRHSTCGVSHVFHFNALDKHSPAFNVFRSEEKRHVQVVSERVLPLTMLV